MANEEIAKLQRQIKELENAKFKERYGITKTQADALVRCFNERLGLNSRLRDIEYDVMRLRTKSIFPSTLVISLVMFLLTSVFVSVFVTWSLLV
jgi:hypothetical protein